MHQPVPLWAQLILMFCGQCLIEHTHQFQRGDGSKPTLLDWTSDQNSPEPSIEKLRTPRTKISWTIAKSFGLTSIHFYGTDMILKSHDWPNPEPTAVGAFSSAVAVHVTSRR
jgi:hypothetical protein